MKKGLFPALVALTLAVLVSSGSAALAQESVTNITVSENEERIYAAIGSIANIQFEDGEPAWILSGGWKLLATITSADQGELSFRGSTLMVRMDGTAMHSHEFSDFVLQSWSEGNDTITFEGTATITLRDGPQSGVPVKIVIFNAGSIAIAIDAAAVDHFGSEPIYGVVVNTYDSSAGQPSDGSGEAPPTTSPPADSPPTSVDVVIDTIGYYGNATGFLAYPANGTSLPAVVMIHEWWGLNENIKNEAQKLAESGYAVLAVDLYEGRVAEDSGAAGAYAAEVRDNPGRAIENLQAAIDHLASLQNVDSSRIASLGWCFGGGQSLQIALNTERPLAATVIYYGTLVTDPQQLSAIDWPVLGVFGADDQSIPVTTVSEFESALNANGITNEIHIYEGVGHAFANPSGDNYAPEETADAWSKTLEFLEAHV